VSSLRAGDADDTVRVTRFTAPRADGLDGVGDRELFVLTALSIHEHLTIENFAETLNMAPGICRATCRQLESLGVLVSDRSGRSFQLHEPWQPVVDKVLRQKQFLHGK
jgi:DNA-binding IclR family transcriptional regulator